MSALSKILIVLQLVFAVAVSVLLVLMISNQQNYKDAAATANARASSLSAEVQMGQNANAAAEARASEASKKEAQASNDLAKLRAESNAKQQSDQSRILTLEGEKNALNAQIQTLTAGVAAAQNAINAKDKELGELRPIVNQKTVEYNQLVREHNEAQNQLRANEKAIRALQEQLAAGAPAGATSGAGSDGQVARITNAGPSSGAINARITSVMEGPGRTLIELPLGSRDGIKQDTLMFIYRSSGYVADAVIERVTANTSVAVITKTKEGQAVQVGDTISTLGR